MTTLFVEDLPLSVKMQQRKSFFARGNPSRKLFRCTHNAIVNIYLNCRQESYMEQLSAGVNSVYHTIISSVVVITRYCGMSISRCKIWVLLLKVTLIWQAHVCWLPYKKIPSLPEENLSGYCSVSHIIHLSISISDMSLEDQ